MLNTVWGGTEITTTRVLVAVVAEVALVLYMVWALRLFGR